MTNTAQSTLNVRGISPAAIAEIKAQARARNTTVGVAIERMVELFTACRASDDLYIRAMLAEVGLEPITH